ncbi:hypothetical protein QQS21_012131 [Conoideocrella luteorostrata]|uniref:Cyanovirin-N domain-containing protein n=1 Tax=Conoideocrella luteorostrata TaxID=1105319 RepID=A0AAJ0FV59_9HYPO|nr:hypothetical protein QQS21_012131 [Conoideocrella luteorostrata]
MAFQSTSRGIHLAGSSLRAECQGLDMKWRSTSLNLNNVLGNSNGKFSLLDKDFSRSAENFHLDGTKLFACLRRLDGQCANATLDLNLCIVNNNGDLAFQKPSNSLLTSASSYSLEGTRLKALCLGHDGLFYVSEIDLGEHYGNNNGEFVKDDRNFHSSAREISIQSSPHSLLLKAELKGNHWWSGDFWKASEIDLAVNILVFNGRLVFEHHHKGLLDPDGPVTKFLEELPFVGFVVAGIHALSGDEQHAKRALAVCANSSIVCASIIVGAWIGGPIGASIGAGLATPLAILVEIQIAGIIKDPRLQAQFEEATIGRYLYETFRNMLTAGAAAYLGSFLNVQAEKLSAKTLGEVASQISGSTAGFSSEVTAYWALKKLANALSEGKLPAGWIETEKRVMKL